MYNAAKGMLEKMRNCFTYCRKNINFNAWFSPEKLLKNVTFVHAPFHTVGLKKEELTKELKNEINKLMKDVEVIKYENHNTLQQNDCAEGNYTLKIALQNIITHFYWRYNVRCLEDVSFYFSVEYKKNNEENFFTVLEEVNDSDDQYDEDLNGYVSKLEFQKGKDEFVKILGISHWSEKTLLAFLCCLFDWDGTSSGKKHAVDFYYLF